MQILFATSLFKGTNSVLTLVETQAAPKVEDTFNCPFCNSHKSVSCTMDWENERGTVECSECKLGFTCNINHLTEPIDIYHEWVDQCDEANQAG